MIATEQATLDHAVYLATRLRDADRQEVWASTGEDPKEVLPRAVALSRIKRIIVDRNKEPVAIYGIQPENGSSLFQASQLGIIWMLATPGLDKEWMSFLRSCRGLCYRAALDGRFDILWNLIWAKSPNLRWLRWMGFVIKEPIKTGPWGEQFLPFHMWTYKLRGRLLRGKPKYV